MKGKIMLEESIEITSVGLDLVQNMHLREEGFVEALGFVLKNILVD